MDSYWHGPNENNINYLRYLETLGNEMILINLGSHRLITFHVDRTVVMNAPNRVSPIISTLSRLNYLMALENAIGFLLIAASSGRPRFFCKGCSWFVLIRYKINHSPLIKIDTEGSIRYKKLRKPTISFLSMRWDQ